MVIASQLLLYNQLIALQLLITHLTNDIPSTSANNRKISLTSSSHHLELIASWNNLLNWSENAAVARRLQEEIIAQKHSLESIAIDGEECLDTEDAIREKIQELIVSGFIVFLTALIWRGVEESYVTKLKKV